jgi:hypothetical protein
MSADKSSEKLGKTIIHEGKVVRGGYIDPAKIPDRQVAPQGQKYKEEEEEEEEDI